MKFRQTFRIAVIASISCNSLSAAAAANKDAQAQKKLEEALNEHYTAAKYDKAERALRSAVDLCGAKFCSKELVAKLHVATGVVRAKTSSDLTTARKEFEKAKKADPNANLDPTLVSPPVAKPVVVEFYKVMGREIPAEYAKTVGPLGNLHCVPDSNYEIQTAQPIAVVCDPLEGAVRAELHYRFSGESDFTALLMTVQDGTFRANIPCEPLTKPGELEMYVVAQDVNKEKIDSFGSASGPARYEIVASTSSPVPSYPGQAPPKRCTELLAGGAALGEACTATQPCKHGLYCGEGVCQKAPACESDSDCASDRCSDGYCSMDEAEANRNTKPSRWLVGLHGGLDLWFATSYDNVCGNASQRDGDFYCYDRGEERITGGLPMADPNSPGDIAAGFRVATVRVMASVDYLLTNRLSVGGRLGWAFLGGPRAIHFDSSGRASQKGSFIPVHVEARGTYWFTPLERMGMHPYVHVSAGMANVDVKTPISASLNGATRKYDAWRRMGPVFAGAGLGLLYNVTPLIGAQLNVNGMFLLPTTGIVVEPSLGGVVAF